jgi:urease accessory protein
MAGDWDAVARVDALLTALKLAPEIRAASLATGQAMLRAAREVFPGSALERYTALAGAGRAPGNAAAAFGCVAADLGLPVPVAVLAFLWTVASGLTAVATRLVPLGAIAAQRRLRELAPAIAAAAGDATGRGEDDLGASALSEDVAALRHANLYSRLCIS